MEKTNDNQSKGRKYHYFVDSEKFDVDEPTVTGALIKLKLPETKRSYDLYLEGQGNDPNELITDDRTISLEKGTKHFTTVPPATFGGL